jgi:hypothetical protein
MHTLCCTSLYVVRDTETTYSICKINRLLHSNKLEYLVFLVASSVADPDPPDPHVFGPPGSGSTSLSNGSDPDPSISMQK